MFKDLCRTVHLAQDDNHLVVDEFLELSQVAGHVHFQLRPDLRIAGKQKGYKMEETETTRVQGCVLSYLFAGDILQVFLHHDLPQTGFDLSLRQLPFCRPAEAPPKTNLPSLLPVKQLLHNGAVLGYLHIREEHGRIRAVRLHVLHGVPLVDAYLVGGDPALVVADPGEKQAAGEVVVTTSHFTRFVKRLKG